MTPLTELIARFNPNEPHFRPTELFNEGWLLRLVLNAASDIPFDGFPISFMPDSDWFSEALLPTAFRARSRSDSLAESRTNADGVLGHFKIGSAGKADLLLNSSASQFVVVEAKIRSPLSSGTSNAPGFDQAARSIACIAEVLREAKRVPDNSIRLGFVVLAPAAELPSLTPLLQCDSIRSKVDDRVKLYKGASQRVEEWHREWFAPTLKRVHLDAVSWEEALDWVARASSEDGKALREFYGRCLEFN